MKLLEIIENLDKAKNIILYPSLYDLFEEFGIMKHLCITPNMQLKKYYIHKQYYTDNVNLFAYFLNNEFACVGNLPIGKHTETFEFVSEEMCIKVKDYLKSIIVGGKTYNYINFNKDYACEKEEIKTTNCILKETNEYVTIERVKLVLTEAEKDYVDLTYHKQYDECFVRIFKNGETKIVLASEIEIL